MSSCLNDIAENILCFIHVDTREMFQVQSTGENSLLDRLLVLDFLG